MSSISPNFSVLMSVYFKDKPMYLNEALESIWTNQSLKPNEVVIVLDGPLTKGLYSVLEEWASRLLESLQIIQLEKNLGLAGALNIGLSNCRYEIVARMDADDVSLPNRFELMINYINNRLDVAACSSWVDEYDSDLKSWISTRKVPGDSDSIKKFSKLRSPLNHPASVFRKSVIVASGGYPEFRNSQDYALWSKLIVDGAKLENVQQVLLKMRTGGGFYERRSFRYLINEMKVILYQRKIGFLTNKELLVSYCIRIVARLVPKKIKKIIYRSTRN